MSMPLKIIIGIIIYLPLSFLLAVLIGKIIAYDPLKPGTSMFLWVGRTVNWKDKKVIVVRRIDKQYVMVALASRQYMRFMVKREDITHIR